MLKTLTTVASVALPIEERWSIKRCRYAPDGESVGRVCIATGTHGDEMMGQLIVYLVQQRIAAHPDALRGTVDFYPMLNPLGLDIGERMVPSGTRLDMNRAFPWLAGRHAAGIHVLSGHSGYARRGFRAGSPRPSARNKSELYEVRVSAKEADRLLPRVRALCPQLIWVYPDKGSFSASLTGALAAEGVDAVILEADERRRLPQEIAAAVVDGIFCKLKEMGIWTATPSTRRLRPQTSLPYTRARTSAAWPASSPACMCRRTASARAWKRDRCSARLSTRWKARRAKQSKPRAPGWCSASAAILPYIPAR